jgi:hypothetical protein
VAGSSSIAALRKLSAAVVAVLAVAVLAGCAASTPADASALPRYYEINDLIKAVAAQQRADQTARLSLRGEITGLGAEEPIRFTGDGVLRVAADAVSLKFTQVVTRRGSPPQETGFVVLPDAVYLRLPHEAGKRRDKPWVRVDPSSKKQDDRVLASVADTLAASAEPMSSLARYADATLVTDAADDLVDGAPAVRYTIVVDLARAAMLERDEKRRAQLEHQVRSGLNRVTSRLWLDAAGRPVRSDVRQELPGIGLLAITGSYREWGQPVEIAAPAASQVQ